MHPPQNCDVELIGTSNSSFVVYIAVLLFHREHILSVTTDLSRFC